MKRLTGIHRRLLGFYGEGTVNIRTVYRWGIKSRDSGGNLDVHNQGLSGRLTVTDNLNRQRFDEVIQENGGKSTASLNAKSLKSLKERINRVR
jgi:hypothetical protein